MLLKQTKETIEANPNLNLDKRIKSIKRRFPKLTTDDQRREMALLEIEEDYKTALKFKKVHTEKSKNILQQILDGDIPGPKKILNLFFDDPRDVAKFNLFDALRNLLNQRKGISDAEFKSLCRIGNADPYQATIVEQKFEEKGLIRKTHTSNLTDTKKEGPKR